MRLLPALLATALAPATAASEPAINQTLGDPKAVSDVVLIPDSNLSKMPVLDPDSAQPKDCPRTSGYIADRRGKPLAPKKLTELPPAITYMAVYRHIGGCEAPLTMADYRNARRR